MGLFLAFQTGTHTPLEKHGCLQQREADSCKNLHPGAGLQ